MIPRSPASMLSGGRKSGISLALNGGGPSAPGAIALRERLSARSRVTNLGILLLLGVCSLSVLMNLRFILFSRGGRATGNNLPPPGFGSWTTFHGLTPKMLQENQPQPATGSENLNHLVLVVGHAVWAGCDFRERENDENWVLEDYQRGGSVKTYWKHIEKGVEIADADPTALLVFSGGQTRPTSLQTEAESYFSLAISSGSSLPVLPGFNFSTPNGGGPGEAHASKAITADASAILGRVGSGAQANAGVAVAKGLQGVRMTTENFALDSFENLLFSIARFREFTGRYPARVTVVGFKMKKSRFEELHAKAIRWPIKGYYERQRKWHYVGIDDDTDAEALSAEYEGEKIKGFRLFERDMYGCHGVLQAKRRMRNPTRRFHSYYTSAPELADLLDWCPPDEVGLQGVYPHHLPWDPRITTDGWGRGAKSYREQHRGGVIPDPRFLEVHADRF